MGFKFIRSDYKEVHSADGQTYIERNPKEQWDVVFKGTKLGSTRIRKDARLAMRILKSYNVSGDVHSILLKFLGNYSTNG